MPMVKELQSASFLPRLLLNLNGIYLSEISLHFTSSMVPDLSGGSLGIVAEHLRQSPGLGLRQITTGSLDSIPNDASTVLVIDPEMCEALEGCMDALLSQEFQKCALSCKGLILISRGATGNTPTPEGALTIGFAQSLRLEQPGIRYVTLDLDPDTSHRAIDERLSRWLTKLLTSETFDFDRGSIGLDCEFAERSGQLYANRVFHNERLDHGIVRATARAKPEQTAFLQRSRPLRVELGVPVLMETFRWADAVEHARGLAPDEIRIECRAASINFRDVLVASVELGASATMMNDCASTVVEVGSSMTSRYAVGDRVCSYYAQSYNNYPVVDGHHCARIPDNVSFALGASLPIVWATTYHSWVNVAKMQAGESILIHPAAGAVGQAAAILAKHLGAVVYATCGSQEKRARLESLGVPQEHIFTSRSAAFGPALLAATKNRGINVILNSLAGELFRESLECLESFGRFIEIGKKDFLDDALPTKFLLRNITFSCVDLVQMINEDKMLVRRLLNDVVDLVDFFVVLSSIAGVIVHPTQVNYTAACTCAFQDAFMHYRRGRGQPAFAIEVGVVGDAGFVSESPAVFANMKHQGFAIISVAELLVTLDYVLAASGPECQAAIGLVPDAGIKKPDWFEQRHLSHLVQDSALFAGAELDDGSGSRSDHIDKIGRAKTVEEAVEAVGAAVLDELSNLIVTPVDRILPHRTLDSYGVDSLVVVKLRNWVVAMLAADVSLLLIRESRNIENLIQFVAGKSSMK